MEDINNPRLRSRRPKIHLSSLEEKSDDSDKSMDLTTIKRKRKIKVQNEAQAKKIMSQDILRIYKEQRSKGDDGSGKVIPDSDTEDEDGTHDEDDTAEGTIQHEHENNNSDVDHTNNQEDSDHEYHPIIQDEESTSEDDMFLNAQVSTDLGHEEPNVEDQELRTQAIDGIIDKGNEQTDNLLLEEEERQQRLRELKRKQIQRERWEQNNREQERQDLEQQKKIEEEQHRLKELKRQTDQREREQREKEQRGRERQEHRERERREHREREQREQERREHRERERQERERQEQRERERREQREGEQQEREHRDRMGRERERRNRLERDQRNREPPERRIITDDEEEDVTNPVYIGGNIFIPSLSYVEAFREYRPAKFITIMSHAIWGYKNLALRAVKVMDKNRNKLPLTPAKKVVLEKQYGKFLKKRNLSRDMESVERNRINKYLGRSITSAEKKMKNAE